MELVEPSLHYAESFQEAMREFAVRPIPGAYGYRDDVPLKEYIERLKKDAQGIDLPEGYVPATMFWLVDEGEYIGHVNLRHRLTPALERLGGHMGYAIRPSKQGRGYGTGMCALALRKAKELGISRVLVTCDKNNVRSRRVIERNGGVLQDEIINEGRAEPTLRFWIETGESRISTH